MFPKTKAVWLATIVLVVTGCSSPESRLADFAQQTNHEQAQQNLRVAKGHEELARATGQLVTAQGQARQEFSRLLGTLLAERKSLADQQRESEQSQRWDSRVGSSISAAVLLLACLAPLWLASKVLSFPAAQSTEAVAELVLDELDRPQPKARALKNHRSPSSAIEQHEEIAVVTHRHDRDPDPRPGGA